MRQPDRRLGPHHCSPTHSPVWREKARIRFLREILPKRLPCQPRPHRQPEASSAGHPKNGEERRQSRRLPPGEYLPGVERFLRRPLNRCGTPARRREPLMPETLPLCRDTLRAIRREEGSFPRRHRWATGPNRADLPDGGCHSCAAGRDRDCRSREIRRPAARHTWRAEDFAHPVRLVGGRLDDARPAGPSGPRGRDHRHGRNAGLGGHCHDRCRDHFRNAGNNSELD